MQRRVVDLDVDGESCVLHRVAGEVLHACHHVALQPAGERGPEFTNMVRVLTVRFLGPAPRRMTQHIDAHRPREVGADGAQFAADGIADALLEVDVPGGTTSHRHRERRGIAHHGSAWAIGEADARHSDAFDLGADEHRLVITVVVEEVETCPRGRIAIKTPQPLVFGEVGNKCACCFSDRQALANSLASVIECSDTWHGDLSRIQHRH